MWLEEGENSARWLLALLSTAPNPPPTPGGQLAAADSARTREGGTPTARQNEGIT